MAEEFRRKPPRTAFEQSKNNNWLVVLFFERLQIRLRQNKKYPDLKIWIRTSISAVSNYVWDNNQELYLTRPVYANPLIRLIYWPTKILLGNDIPFIARTESWSSILRSIEIGNPAVLEEAKFTIVELRRQHPDFTIRLVTLDGKILVDEILDGES